MRESLEIFECVSLLFNELESTCILQCRISLVHFTKRKMSKPVNEDGNCDAKVTAKNNDEVLVLFNSLFNRNNINNPGDIDSGTGLPLSNSLIYSLQACILLQDRKWVLAFCDIDNLRELNDDLGYSGANHKIEDIGKIIKKFVSQKPFELKAFRNKINGKGDSFAILIYCSKKIEFCKRFMSRLRKQIYQLSNAKVSIGMTNINKFDKNYTTWINRANDALSNVKQKGGNDVLFNQVDFNLKPLTQKEEQEEEDKEKKTKNGNRSEKKELELGRKEDFDAKMNEIASNDDNNWVISLLDCDNLGDLKELKGNEAAANEIENVKNEIITLCDIMGNNCLGYHVGGDEFGLIMFDNNEKNDFRAKDMIKALIDNVRDSCKVTISAGFSRLDVEECEMRDAWYDRTNDYLKQAKSNGKNQAYWGQDLKKLEIIRSQSTLNVDNKEDDLILTNSLAQIKRKKVDEKKNNDDGDIFIGRSAGSASKESDDLIGITLRGTNGDDKSYLDDIKSSQFKPDIESSGLLSDVLTFDQLYKEMYQFDVDNDHLRWFKKTYQMNTPICNVLQCEKEMNKEYKHILMCETHRRRLGQKLYQICKERGCLNDLIRNIASHLSLSNEMFIDQAKRYKVYSNYFENIYSYLVLQREMVSQLLANLTGGEEESTNAQFEFVFSCHVYLKEICDLLILFYSCFNENYICIFYHLIKQSIGDMASQKIFARKENVDVQSMRKDEEKGKEQNDLATESPGVVIYKLVTRAGDTDVALIKRKQLETEHALQCVSILKQIIFDLYSNSNSNGNNSQNDENENEENSDDMQNPLNFVSLVSSKLTQLVNNIKSENYIARLEKEINDENNAEEIELPRSWSLELTNMRENVSFLDEENRQISRKQLFSVFEHSFDPLGDALRVMNEFWDNESDLIDSNTKSTNIYIPKEIRLIILSFMVFVESTMEFRDESTDDSDGSDSDDDELLPFTDIPQLVESMQLRPYTIAISIPNTSYLSTNKYGIKMNYILNQLTFTPHCEQDCNGHLFLCIEKFDMRKLKSDNNFDFVPLCNQSVVYRKIEKFDVNDAIDKEIIINPNLKLDFGYLYIFWVNSFFNGQGTPNGYWIYNDGSRCKNEKLFWKKKNKLTFGDLSFRSTNNNQLIYKWGNEGINSTRRFFTIQFCTSSHGGNELVMCDNDPTYHLMNQPESEATTETNDSESSDTTVTPVDGHE